MIFLISSAGIASAVKSPPRSTLAFQASISLIITSPASLACLPVNIGDISLITLLESFSSGSPVSSKPDAPRNLPKPSCAAPATPPSKDEKPVCKALYSSCAPAAIIVFCAITSCNTAAPASNATVCFKDLVAAVSSNSFCFFCIASLASTLRPSEATRFDTSPYNLPLCFVV